jgi:hypothetical protein
LRVGIAKAVDVVAVAIDLRSQGGVSRPYEGRLVHNARDVPLIEIGTTVEMEALRVQTRQCEIDRRYIRDCDLLDRYQAALGRDCAAVPYRG